MSLRMRRTVVIVAATLIVVAAAVAIRAYASPDLAWRMRVVWAKVSGGLPEIPLIDLLRWLKPGSPVQLQHLADAPSPNSAIVNPFIDSESIEKGSKLYGRSCAHCHGVDARGATGPDLVAMMGNMPDWPYFSAVKWGHKGSAMTAQALSDFEIWQTHAFVRKLTLDAAGSGGDRVRSTLLQKIGIPAESILAAADRPAEWVTYAGRYAGHRHSSLAQISARNVHDLRVSWLAQLRSVDRSLEASPIVAGGLIFVTESPEGVVALDARNGARVWHYRRPVPNKLPLCCAAANRGVAILEDSIFMATVDAHLIALDATTGRKKWETKVAESRDGYSITGAPLALKDRVVTGVAGSEYGVRGFVAAFAPSDGKLLWKFDTVPGPGEPGSETWQNDAWKTGGGSTWTTGAYDAERDLIIWGVGSPAPDFQSDVRPGDNLFTNSVVALDARSGKLRWHFQFTPAGQHDWDSVQQPVLAEISFQGQSRPVVLWANRNGFFYAIDRYTGQFLFAKPFVKQTWAARIKPDGRPVFRPEAKPNRSGSLVWPGVQGGTNWWPPSYDASRGLLYVPTVDAASVYFSGDARYKRGKMFLGGTSKTASNQPVAASVKAIDVQTGDLRWEAKLMQGGSENVHRVVGGLLSTDGGLAFGGYRDEFFAFDADTGKVLWQIRLGGYINAAPVTYEIGDTQYIAIMAGQCLFAFSLPWK